MNVTDVTEGDFLSRAGVRATFFIPKIYNEPDPVGKSDYIYVACTLLGMVSSEFGSGTLATVTFLVEAEGESVLDLYDTIMGHPLFPTPIEHIVEDGYFFSTPVPIVTATIDIDPETLNLKGKGKWIATYVELPEDYNVRDIDVSTVKLNDEIPAESHPTEVGDYDSDGIPDLMVKFSRQDLRNLLSVGEATLSVTGEVAGTRFEGSDTIRVIDG